MPAFDIWRFSLLLLLLQPLRQVINPEEIWYPNRCMCAIYSRHPKLCHQPDHTFINGLRVYWPPISTKIRLLLWLKVHLKCHQTGRQDVIFLCVSLTPKAPTNCTNTHTHLSLFLCVYQTVIHSDISSDGVWVQKVSKCQECFLHN